MKRKICIVTGSRAEYGLIYWLMKEIQEDPHLELQIIATGMHLSPEFGLTYKVIEKDGFMISEKVEMLLSSDTPVAIAKSMGLGVIGFADAFERLKPDIIVVLGDRYEIFASVTAAMAMTMENPKCIDIITAAMEPTTEVQPFIAHSHGIISPLFCLTLLTARGKGIPITKPSGSMNRVE